MSLWDKFLGNVRLRRFVVLLGLVGILYLSRSLISMILLTFIFTFLITRLITTIHRHVRIPSQLIVIAVYLALIGLIYMAVTVYVPKLVAQSEAMVTSVMQFYDNPPKGANELIGFISDYIGKLDIMKQVKGSFAIVFKYVTSIGSMGFTLFMSLLLSFFFTIEERQTAEFSKSFLSGGPFAWVFQDICYFANIFVNSFGVVMEAQFMIAIVNTVITTTCLGFMKMPQLFSLGLMIFVLSLIPVAGVIISAVPLCFIGYTVGGLRDVCYIVILLIVVHALESYVFNPKLMSSRTELPIFYTFVVLFVSEHLFGTWGLIVGIPIFTFMLDVLGVKPVHTKHDKLEKLRKQDADNEQG